MTIRIRAALAATLLFTMGGAVVRAQGPSVPVYDFTAVQAQSAVLDRMEELETEVASLRHELLASGCDDKGGSCGVDGDKIGKGVGGCGPTIEFWTDATLLRFHKTGGVQTGSDAFTNANPEAIELGFIASPRINLRYYRPNGMFIQGTFFQFNHSTVLGPDSIQVNSYTFDIVFGQRIQLNEDWMFEVTGGPRRFRYKETLTDGDEVEFNFDKSRGIGGVVGIKAFRRVDRGILARLLNVDQALYGGANFAIVHGDHRITENRGLPTNINLTDENFIQMELSTGSEYIKTLANGAEFYFHWGVEWVTYENASSQFSFTAPGLAGHELSVAPGADVGFGGFTASAGIRY